MASGERIPGGSGEQIPGGSGERIPDGSDEHVSGETGEGTQRLFWDDPFQTDFEAIVLEVREAQEGALVVLDRTAFYPEGGGQPADEGRLGEAEVFDVQSERGVIVHHIDIPLAVGEKVEGAINWPRRWEIMQQHTGQHLLSRVLLDTWGARTQGFHLGEEESTIDLSRELTPADLLQAVIRANALVDEDLPVTVRLVEADDEAVRQARRPPPDGTTGRIRLVEIGAFDAVPCGGTHVPSTARIGGIHVLASGSSRAHGLFRITFLCGIRLRRRLTELDRIAAELGEILTTGALNFPDRVSDIMEQHRDLRHEIAALERALVPLRVSALLGGAEQIGSARVIVARLDDLPPETLPAVATELVGHDDVVALLGAGVEGTARLLFARGDGLDLDAGALLGEAAAIVGGGGGGKPGYASGGGPRGEALDTALTEAIESVRKRLT